MTVSTSTVDVRPIFFDLECNGIIEEGKMLPSITQLAAYDPTRSAAQARFSVFLRPEPQYQIPSSKEAKVDLQLKTFSQVWPEFKKWCTEKRSATTRIVLIAHNAWGHDQKLLKGECARIGDDLPRDWKVFDTQALAKTMRVYPSVALQSLRDFYKLPANIAHMAMDDVDTLYNVFLKMTAGADRKQVFASMLDDHPVLTLVSLLKTDKVALPILNKKGPIIPIYYDTETTGLFSENPNVPKPRVVEISAYTPTRKGEQAYFSAMVNPEMEIPEEASNVHGITNQMVSKKPNFKVTWRRFLNWCHENEEKDCRYVLIAHNNYMYDKKVLDAETARIGEIVPKDWRMFDTYRLANSVLKGVKEPGEDGKPKAVSKKLQDLAKRYNCVPKEAHRAMADVETMYAVMSTWIGNIPQDKIYEAMFTPHPILAVANIIAEAKLTAPKEEPTEPIESFKVPAAAAKPGSKRPQVPEKKSDSDTEEDEELLIMADRLEEPSPLKRLRKNTKVIED